MKKQGRGAYDYRTDRSKSISVVSWNNNIVNVATNSDQVHPTKQVSRYSQAAKKKIQINQPKLISNYNKYMGGIDRADQNISLYRTSIRGKKWYFSIICYMIDLAEQNAWQVYRQDGGRLDQLAFKRCIALAILEKNKRILSTRGRLPMARPKSLDSRFDRMDHFVAELDDIPNEKGGDRKKQMRCGFCNNKCTTKCVKCDISLHVKYFIRYLTP